MKITNIVRIELTNEDVRESLRLYNEDMMFELAEQFFGRRGGRYSGPEMAKFAAAIADPIRRGELSRNACIAYVDVPDTVPGWCDLITEMPMIFLPSDVLTNGEASTLQITFNGRFLDVVKILENA